MEKNQENRVPASIEITNQIPLIYQKFQELFEDNITTILIQHQPWDYKIIFKLGTKLLFLSIYKNSEKELQTLKKQIDNSLKKGFIKLSQLSARFLVLFILKKNKKLRLYIDYRQLNYITVKNRYLLPNVLELQNRLEKAKQFTLLNQQNIYYSIRIKKGNKQKIAFRTCYRYYKF